MVGVTVVKKTGEKREPTANEVMVKEIVEERKKWTTGSTIFLSEVVRAMVVRAMVRVVRDSRWRAWCPCQRAVATKEKEVPLPPPPPPRRRPPPRRPFIFRPRNKQHRPPIVQFHGLTLWNIL